MSNPLVLVVDDEKPMREFVRRNLEVRGFSVLTAGNGLEALAQHNTNNIDLLILDVMMPHMNGLETIRRIRESSMVPIIVLTALGEEDDKVRAFDLGADDYLTKPFGVGELLARVRAVMRRASWSEPAGEPSRLMRGYIRVDRDRHSVQVRGREVEMTPTEMSLLIYLMENAGRVLTHRDILRRVWGPEYGDETEYLRVYVGRVRQKIEEDPAAPRLIETVRGLGYMFAE